ncbi:MAG: glycosyltransferase family 4 protein [Caldilineales bacterium]
MVLPTDTALYSYGRRKTTPTRQSPHHHNQLSALGRGSSLALAGGAAGHPAQTRTGHRYPGASVRRPGQPHHRRPPGPSFSLRASPLGDTDPRRSAHNKIRRNPGYLLLLPGYLLAGGLAAWRLGRSGRYDILHVHWPMPQGLMGVVARWAGGGRLVATFYGADLVMSRRFPFVRPLVRSFARRCAEVAAISSYTAREVRQSTGISPRVIPYGIAMPPENQAWPAQPGMILTVGRLVARKGHAYLIEAMARLDAPDAHLVIVGEGHERPDLESRVRALQLKDRVTFAGRVSDAELNRLYQSCQVFVLPAIVDSSGDTEMLGMVSLEAMRYGKPVVATRVGGIADIVQDRTTGLMVEQRDAGALAAAIDRLLADADLAACLGHAGYLYARDHFSWDAVVQQTLALYGLAEA